MQENSGQNPIIQEQLNCLSYQKRKEKIFQVRIPKPEMYMAKTGSLASQSAAHLNRLFKAKRMRDDLVFIKDSDRERADFTSLHKNIFKEGT